MQYILKIVPESMLPEGICLAVPYFLCMTAIFCVG
jgi:hypothetical protein